MNKYVIAAQRQSERKEKQLENNLNEETLPLKHVLCFFCYSAWIIELENDVRVEFDTRKLFSPS